MDLGLTLIARDRQPTPASYAPEPGSTGHALLRCACFERQRPPASYAKRLISMGHAVPCCTCSEHQQPPVPMQSSPALWVPPFPTTSVKPSPPAPPSSSMHDNVFTMVASAMRDISITQQKLSRSATHPISELQWRTRPVPPLQATI